MSVKVASVNEGKPIISPMVSLNVVKSLSPTSREPIKLSLSKAASNSSSKNPSNSSSKNPSNSSSKTPSNSSSNSTQKASSQNQKLSPQSSTSSSTASYDEDDTDTYKDDKQMVCNGSEANPEFTNCHVLTKTREKTLKPDLRAAGFSPEIVMKADEIFLQMNSGPKRGVRRRQLMFFCVQSAYNELRIPEDPQHLAHMCSITNSEISKAYSMCSPSKVGYKPRCVFWLPEDYLRMYYQKMVDRDIIAHNPKVLEDLYKICAEVMRASPELKEEKPQNCAQSILLYYLEIQNYTLDKNKFNEIFNKSEASITKIKNKVRSAYTSSP